MSFTMNALDPHHVLSYITKCQARAPGINMNTPPQQQNTPACSPIVVCAVLILQLPQTA